MDGLARLAAFVRHPLRMWTPTLAREVDSVVSPPDNITLITVSERWDVVRFLDDLYAMQHPLLTPWLARVIHCDSTSSALETIINDPTGRRIMVLADMDAVQLPEKDSPALRTSASGLLWLLAGLKTRGLLNTRVKVFVLFPQTFAFVREMLESQIWREQALRFIPGEDYFEVEDLSAALKWLVKYPYLWEKLRVTYGSAKQLDPIEKTPPILGDSETIQHVRFLVDRASSSQAKVLILGPTGSGKGLIAKNIHERSQRSTGPFIAINCGAFDKSLLGSELFGHEKGAFTGADRLHKGAIEQADGGTLFLDEVGELSESAQVRLLKVLDHGPFYRVGGEEPIRVNVRTIAATNRNLTADMMSGKFREDLYWRLHVLVINVPPLDQRRSDIPILARHFWNQINETEKKDLVLGDEALDVLMEQQWPGNIRQLQNILESLSAYATGKRISLDDVHGAIQKDLSFHREWPALHVDEMPTVEQIAGAYCRTLLEAFKGNKTRAAEKAGLSRKTFLRKLKS